ncbi:MAG: hypothetical protein HYR96_02500 [Deltaproteobacteria bacterium]|nr:hypothetical protein [Deltaproteobacteria bacterium]
MEFVLGQQIEPVKLAVLVPKVLNSTGQVDVSAGIGIDSTSSNSANVYGGKAHTVGTSTFASYTGFPGVGYHYGQWLEIAQASNTTTWYTDLQSGGSQRMGGLRGEIWN